MTVLLDADLVDGTGARDPVYAPRAAALDPALLLHDAAAAADADEPAAGNTHRARPQAFDAANVDPRLLELAPSAPQTRPRRSTPSSSHRPKTSSHRPASPDFPSPSAHKRAPAAGTLVPEHPCVRCANAGRASQCLVTLVGGACNPCHRNKRPCDLVDPAMRGKRRRRPQTAAAV